MHHNINILWILPCLVQGVVCMDDCSDQAPVFQPASCEYDDLDATIEEVKVLLPQRTKRKLSIIVVEDNDCMRKVEEKMLQGMGHDVETLSNGEDAIIRIQDSPPPDVILLDQNLGEDKLLGTQAAKIIHGRRPNIVLIGVTSEAQEPVYESLREAAGMSGSIKKPVSPKALETVLDAYLKGNEKEPKLHSE